MNHFKLQEKTVCLVSPPTRLTATIMSAFIEHGADVTLVNTLGKESQKMAEGLSDLREIKPQAGRAAALTYDLAQTDGAKQAVQKTMETFGGFDILIDGMGLTATAGFFTDPNLAQLEQGLQTHLKPTLNMVSAAWPVLQKRKKGRVLFLLSELQRLGYEKTLLAGALRTGVESLARGLARLGTSDGITVNCLAIGPSEDELRELFPQAASATAAREHLLALYPQVQIADADKIAQTLLFLASPQALALNGQIIAASNGLTVGV